MDNRTVLQITREAAADATKQFFAPLAVAFRLIWRKNHVILQYDHEYDAEHFDFEEVKTMLRDGLARSRQRERVLVTECIVSGILSVVASSISVLHVFEIKGMAVLAIILGISCLTGVLIYRIIRNREDIVETKMLYRLMKSVNAKTREDVILQIYRHQNKTGGHRAGRTSGRSKKVL